MKPPLANTGVVIDATLSSMHAKDGALLREHKPGIRVTDLRPAAIGPYCVPLVNLERMSTRQTWI